MEFQYARPPEKPKQGRIIIVGTSHIAAQSVLNARRVIDQERPDCVAVELDYNRLQGLRQGQSSKRQTLKALGPVNFMFFMTMKMIQDKLGKRTGILPGEDILAAVDAAQERGIQVALIDRDIGLTFQRLNMVSAKERMRLVFFLIAGITVGPILGKMKKGRRIDLNKVPDKDIIDMALREIRVKFPGIYKALIEERDRYMASRLKVISQRYSKVVAFVGAGHKEEMERLVSQ